MPNVSDPENGTDPVDTLAELAVEEALAEVVATIGGTPRGNQEAMARSVANALEGGEHLLVQAGTGTGKSLAYLVPAALHAVRRGERVVIATATLNLQRQLLDKDVPTVVGGLTQWVGRPIRVALLKGRANYLCRLRLEGSDGEVEELPGMAGALERQQRRIRQWVEETETGDRDDLPENVDSRLWRALSVSGRECVGRNNCTFGQECFAEAARDRARDADLIITNHALLAIHLQSEVPVLPEMSTLVIDEGHELVDRVTSAATEQLAAGSIHSSVRSAGRALARDLRQRLDDLADDLGEVLAEWQSGSPKPGEALPDAVTSVLARVRDVTHAAVTELSGSQREQSAGEGSAVLRARAGLQAVHDLAGRVLAMDEADVVWLSEGTVPTLNVSPLRVGPLVRGRLLAEVTTIGTSATLSLGGSFRDVARDWGLVSEGRQLPTSAESTPPHPSPPDPSRWAHQDVGSPFDYARQGILYCPPSVGVPGREGISDRQLAEIGALVRASSGGALILTTSWRSVDRVTEYLQDAAIPGIRVLVQRRGEPSGRLLGEFAEDVDSVLVGTRSLWQGVDVPGRSCRLVVLERIPFSRPDDPVLSARQRDVESHGGSGFATVQLPRAALLMAQGAGRLIRSTEDRGVVAVLDSRLASGKGYSTYLRRSLPPFWTTGDQTVAVGALRRLGAAEDAAASR